jgi:hypothetical protein
LDTPCHTPMQVEKEVGDVLVVKDDLEKTCQPKSESR